MLGGTILGGAGLQRANTFCKISFLETRFDLRLDDSSPSPFTEGSRDVEFTEIAVSGRRPSFRTSLYIFM